MDKVIKLKEAYIEKIERKVKSDLSNEYREELLHLIAYENRDKLIFITFHEYHTFESL